MERRLQPRALSDLYFRAFQKRLVTSCLYSPIFRLSISTAMRQKNAHFDVHPDIIFYPSRRENPSTFAENIFFYFPCTLLAIDQILYRISKFRASPLTETEYLRT